MMAAGYDRVAGTPPPPAAWRREAPVRADLCRPRSVCHRNSPTQIRRAVRAQAGHRRRRRPSRFASATIRAPPKVADTNRRKGIARCRQTAGRRRGAGWLGDLGRDRLDAGITTDRRRPPTGQRQARAPTARQPRVPTVWISSTS
jgi:hypothetical protein